MTRRQWTPRTLGHKAVALHADALDTGVHPQLQWWVACRQASTPAAAIINVGLHLRLLRMPREPIDTRLQKWDITNRRGSHVIPQYLDASHHPVVRALAASIVLMLHQPPTTRWKGLMHHLYKGLVGCGSQKLPATRPVVHWANDAGVHRGSQRDQPATTSAPAPSQGGVGQWKWSSRKGGSDTRRQRCTTCDATRVSLRTSVVFMLREAQQ